MTDHDHDRLEEMLSTLAPRPADEQLRSKIQSELAKDRFFKRGAALSLIAVAASLLLIFSGVWWFLASKMHSSRAKATDQQKGPATLPTSSGSGDVDPRLGELTKEFFDAGGSRESEAAVQLGLEWLAKHQSDNGGWSFSDYGRDKHGRDCTCEPGRCKDNEVAATAFGLLPFIAHGFTHKGTEDKNKYVKVVDDAIRRLLKMQNKDGSFSGNSTENNMYTHGLATICLCETLNMSSDFERLKEPCERAVKYIVEAQHKDGGWRYQPKQEGDLSVVSWQLMALKSAQMAGIVIPNSYEVLKKADDFLTTCSYVKWAKVDGHSRNDLMTKTQLAGMGGPKGMEIVEDGGYCYQPNGFNMVGKPEAPATMTAAGILCRQYLKTKDDLSDKMSLRSAEMTRGLHHILDNMPTTDLKSIYYYYYATQVLYNIHDESWAKWNAAMRDLLVQTQEKTGHLKGSWDPTGDQFGGHGGRIMMTSMALLTLEVYYRHLSTSQQSKLGIMIGN